MSFLKIVEEFVNENNINIPFIPISSDSLPKEIYLTILELLKVNNNSFVESDIDSISIRFDSNNNAYLYIDAKSSRIAILKNNVLYKKENIIGKKLTESYLIRRSASRDYINYVESTKNIDPRYKKDYSEIESIESLYNKTARKLLKYILYINSYYIEANLPKELTFEYIEANKEPQTRKNYTEGNGTYERKYPILEFSTRNEVLLSHKPKLIGNLISKNSKSITHKSFLYNLGTDQNLIIIEPIDGDSYTKYIYCNGNIDLEKFVEITQYAMRLTKSQILDSKYAFQTKHTTLELFINVIDCTINGTEDHKIHQYTLDNIQKCRGNI